MDHVALSIEPDRMRRYNWRINLLFKEVDMPSPFPGMNPWMEAPELWPGVHAALISELRVHLNACLPARYFADVEERVYLCDADDPLIKLIVPDIAVREASVLHDLHAPSVATAIITPSLQARMIEQEITEQRLVIWSTDNQTIVTVIEILSPANKLAGSAGRTSYLAKRREVLESDTHFIEIDLLRAGNRTEPVRGMARGDYLIWLSRSQDRTLFDYWPTSLESPLPTIPVPLLAGDADVVLNLQAVLHEVYDRSGYIRRLNYVLPVPPPPLDDDRIEWLKRCLLTS